jgi:uncharacterized protein YwgA
VLAAADGAALQPVQLQKALFLVGKRLPTIVGPDFYSFTPYHYGPFDSGVYRDAQHLAALGFAYAQPGAWTSYGATPQGVAAIRSLQEQNPELWRFLRELVAWVRAQSFQDLVRAIYSEFPDMKVASIFRA